MDDNFKILVYGFGNPGRQDDGLGYALVSLLEKWIAENDLSFIDLDSNYQLNIEDAEIISNYGAVIFADASTLDIKDYLLTEITGDTEISFTTHAASPAYIVKLCGELFNRIPDAYLFHIKGYEWEFKEDLSKAAENNLRSAIEFLQKFLISYKLQAKN